MGGIVFNAANILFSAAIAIAGMAVAFPIAIGIALVLGVLLNYFALQQGNPVYLFRGGALYVHRDSNECAGFSQGRAAGSAKVSIERDQSFSVIAGVLMSFFYRFIAG